MLGPQVYIYIYTYIYIYIYTCIHLLINYVYIVYVYIHMYRCTCIIYVYIYICIERERAIYYIYTYYNIRIHVYMYIHIYIYIYIYIHVCYCARPSGPSPRRFLRRQVPPHTNHRVTGLPGARNLAIRVGCPLFVSVLPVRPCAVKTSDREKRDEGALQRTNTDRMNVKRAPGTACCVSMNIIISSIISGIIRVQSQNNNQCFQYKYYYRKRATALPPRRPPPPPRVGRCSCARRTSRTCQRTRTRIPGVIVIVSSIIVIHALIHNILVIVCYCQQYHSYCYVSVLVYVRRGRGRRGVVLSGGILYRCWCVCPRAQGQIQRFRLLGLRSSHCTWSRFWGSDCLRVRNQIVKDQPGEQGHDV